MLMKFLRENLYLVIVAGVTLLACVGLLVYRIGLDSEIDAEMVARTKVGQSLKSLGTKPYYNEKTYAASTQYKDNVISSLAAVRQANITWNNRNLSVPTLVTLDKKELDAFPFAMAIWKRNQLYFQFVQYYQKQLDEMVASLRPAPLPKKAEILAEAKKIQKRLKYEEEVRLRQEDDETPGAAGPTDAPVRGGSKTRKVRKDPKLEEKAIEMATQTLRLARSREGLMYISKEALQPLFIASTTTGEIGPEKLWQAQVGLWIRNDIITAIAGTVDASLEEQKIDRAKANVQDSPIKRILSVIIEPSVDEKGRVLSETELQPLVEAVLKPVRKKSTRRRGRSSRRSRSDRGLEEVNKSLPETLTQNQPNVTYDVFDYSFTVLMNTRYLAALEANLLARNYHVIINEEILPAQADESASSRGIAAEEETQSLHYYGADPICRVTITGQLLLLTDVTRGIWSATAKKWTRKPLMPLGVLKKLPSSSWRPSDTLWVGGYLPTPWQGPGATAPRKTMPDKNAKRRKSNKKRR